MRFRLKTANKIIVERAKAVLGSLSQSLGGKEMDDRQSFTEALFGSISRLVNSLVRPRFRRRYISPLSPPRSQVVNASFEEAHEDIQVLYSGQQELAESIASHFNIAQSEQSRLSFLLERTRARLDDYMVMAHNTISRRLVFQERFTDIKRIASSSAHISQREGLVTLAVSGAENYAKDAVILNEGEEPKASPPYSMPGNWFVAYQPVLSSSEKTAKHISGEASEAKWDFYHAQDPRDNLQAALDGKPDTWFEWQMVNVPEEAKRPNPPSRYPDTQGYNWNFDDGTPIYYGDRDKDELSLRMTVDLREVQTINWLSLLPHFPEGSNGYLLVDDVSTSEDGVSFLPIPDSSYRLGTDASTLAPDADIGVSRESLAGRGVWVFSGRPCRYIRFHLRSPQPYGANIGHLYYLVSYDLVSETRILFISTGQRRERRAERVKGPDFPRDAFVRRHDYTKTHGLEGAGAGALLWGVFGPMSLIIGALIGLLVSKKQWVENQSDPEPHWDVYQDGWRWSIGVRDISVNAYTYAERGAIATKAFAVPQGVRSVTLSVDEEVPEEFYSKDLRSRNQWIRYFISPDGNNWHPISPLEHSPVEEAPFPPKVYSGDKNLPPEAGEGERGTFDFDGDVKELYVKIEMRRPEGEEHQTMTPVLRSFTLNVLPKEVSSA